MKHPITISPKSADRPTSRFLVGLLLVVVLAVPAFLAPCLAANEGANIGTAWSLFFSSLQRTPVAVSASPGCRLPVDIGTPTVSIGTPTIVIGSMTDVLPGNGSTSVYVPDGTPVQVTLVPEVLSITIYATGSFEVYVGSTTVTASTTPIYNVSGPTRDTRVIMLGQTATPTEVTVIQDVR
jgi:hypothetical protein